MCVRGYHTNNHIILVPFRLTLFLSNCAHPTSILWPSSPLHLISSSVCYPQDRVRVSLLDQTRTQPHSSTSYTPATPTVQSSPKFPRCQSHLSPSSPSLAVSLPPSASPLRQPRKLADDTRPPPLRQGPALVGVETQAMAVPGFLRRVRGDEMSLGGVPVSKMELFCTQSKVNGVVFLDSLVLSVSLCSGNLISPVSS